VNLWECEHPDCKNRVVGCGSAVGLRAIGWYFEIGSHIFCPAHRPDPAPCHESGNVENADKPCSMCRAEAVATQLQTLIAPDAPRWPDSEIQRQAEQLERAGCPKCGGFRRIRLGWWTKNPTIGCGQCGEIRTLVQS